MDPSDATPFFIRVGADVYGPYGLERVPHFLKEGRLSARTLVSHQPQGPFRPAGGDPRLGPRLSAPGGVEPDTAGEALVPATAHRRDEADLGCGRLLVLALAGDPDGRLTRAAEALGPVLRLGPGALTIECALTATAARNHLTRGGLGLGGLFVTPLDPSASAWFDLPRLTDQALRGG